jgi:hypothetical protein
LSDPCGGCPPSIQKQIPTSRSWSLSFVRPVAARFQILSPRNDSP